MKIKDLKLNEKNPRRIKGERLATLKKSIQDFEKMLELRPIIVDENNVVLGGNMRLQALKALGYKDIPDKWVMKASDLTEDQKKEFIIKDNIGFGEWDFDILANEFDYEKLTEWGFEDFEMKPENSLTAEEDDYEIPDEVQTDIKLGDLFQIGRHRLLCGDSTKEEDVARLMGGEKLISIYTDPPYGINLEGDNSKRGKDTSRMKGGLKLKSFVDDSIEYAVKSYEITRKIKAEKEVWWGANYYCHSLPQSNNWLVWDKRVEEKMKNTNSDCELAYVIDGHSSVRIFRHLWNGLIKASEKGDKRVHPTQKPVKLAAYCFEEYEMGDNILDLFLGSGSTMVACDQTNRKCYGMELDPHYCQVIIDRMKKLNPEIKVEKL
jgi:DNA modification methylase